MISRVLSLIVTVAFAVSTSVHAQVGSSNPFVGHWKLIAADKLLPDGTRVAASAPAPEFLDAILEANGYDVKYWAGVDTDRDGPRRHPRLTLRRRGGSGR
jgi:hypothetical protein